MEAGTYGGDPTSVSLAVRSGAASNESSIIQMEVIVNAYFVIACNGDNLCENNTNKQWIVRLLNIFC